MVLPQMRIEALFSFGLPRIINVIITAEFQRLLSQENLTKKEIALKKNYTINLRE